MKKGMLREGLGVEVYSEIQYVASARATARCMHAEGLRRSRCFYRSLHNVLQLSVHHDVYSTDRTRVTTLQQTSIVLAHLRSKLIVSSPPPMNEAQDQNQDKHEYTPIHRFHRRTCVRRKAFHVISRKLFAIVIHRMITYTEKTEAVSRKRRATMLISRPARPSENLLVEGRPDP